MAAENETREPDDGFPRPRTFSRLLAELAALPRRSSVDLDPGLRQGDVVDNRYQLSEELGRGGFGVVFEAYDRKLNRRVAIKLIRPGGHSPADAQREADVAAQLQHENLVRLYDFGRYPSGAFLVFERLDGETLAQRLRRGPLPPHEAVRIAAEVTRALVHAHAQGVLHRDLKPSNVFLTSGGPAKILDFGLAYYFGQGPARSGTPGYMAPEQARGGEEDARTDVHGVGVLLREMLSGEGVATGSGKRGGRVGFLDRLIDRTNDPDPERRPRDAAHLATELESLGRRLAGPPRWVLGAGAAGLVAAVAVVGATVLDARPRAMVAVADLDNATGDPDLDGLSELVSTSLEQWPRLLILPRQRIRALAGVPGDRDRLDCAAVRDAAQRAGASVVLCSRASRTPGGYAVEVEAVRPGDGGRQFVLGETAASKQQLPALVDRLSERARRAIVPWSIGPRLKPIAPQTSSNLDAYRHYYDGLRCAERPVHGQDCSLEFRQALALDPEFAVAAYQLAVWLAWNGGTLGEQRAWIASAQRLSGSAPEKERTLIRAWAEHLAGDDTAALALLGHAAQAWPQDKHAFYQAGDILRHRNALGEAVPWFEGAIALDPDFPWALGHLAQALGALGRVDALRSWATRWESAPTVGTLHGLSVARGWLGDVPGAADAAQRAIVMGAGVSGQEDLLQASLFSGNYRAVEDGARVLSMKGSSIRRIGYYGLAAVEQYRGRRGAGLALLDRLATEVPEVRDDAVYHTIRADYLLGTGDAAAVWAEVERARRVDPRLAAQHAVSLAYLGDLEHAALLAHDLSAGTGFAETAAALARIRRGEPDAGLEELRRISSTTPVFTWRVAPLYLYGEELAQAGRDVQAVEVLHRAQSLYVPVAMWRSWAYPRSLYLVARSCHRLGRTAEARQSLDRLLSEWSEPEPDAPLLREARGLRAQLPAR